MEIRTFLNENKKLRKFSNEEIFLHYQMENIEKFLKITKEQYSSIKEKCLNDIELWKISYKFRKINYYSPINKLERKYKKIAISIFSYQEENGNWKLIERDEKIGNSSIHNFSDKIQVIKYLNNLSKKNRAS
jgi:hypothetical protein